MWSLGFSHFAQYHNKGDTEGLRFLTDRCVTTAENFPKQKAQGTRLRGFCRPSQWMEDLYQGMLLRNTGHGDREMIL
jgi:hypothetical protein